MKTSVAELAFYFVEFSAFNNPQIATFCFMFPLGYQKTVQYARGRNVLEGGSGSEARRAKRFLVNARLICE